MPVIWIKSTYISITSCILFPNIQCRTKLIVSMDKIPPYPTNCSFSQYLVSSAYTGSIQPKGQLYTPALTAKSVVPLPIELLKDEDVEIPDDLMDDPDEYAYEVTEKVNKERAAHALFNESASPFGGLVVPFHPFISYFRDSNHPAVVLYKSRAYQLPRNVWYTVVSFLDIPDVYALTQISKPFYLEFSRQAVWCTLLLQRVGVQKYNEIMSSYVRQVPTPLLCSESTVPASAAVGKKPDGKKRIRIVETAVGVDVRGMLLCEYAQTTLPSILAPKWRNAVAMAEQTNNLAIFSDIVMENIEVPLTQDTIRAIVAEKNINLQTNFWKSMVKKRKSEVWRVGTLSNKPFDSYLLLIDLSSPLYTE